MEREYKKQQVLTSLGSFFDFMKDSETCKVCIDADLARAEIESPYFDDTTRLTEQEKNWFDALARYLILYEREDQRFEEARTKIIPEIKRLIRWRRRTNEYRGIKEQLLLENISCK